MADDTMGATSSGDAFIADPANVPETGDTPDYIEPVNNLAKDKALTDHMKAWAQTQKSNFDTQEPRQNYCDSGGTMDMADRMYRMALRRDTSSAQTENTLSNVTSSVYLRAIRTVTAGESSIFFSTDELPAEYNAEVNTTEYTAAQGAMIAEQQNMLAEFTSDEDKRVQTYKELLWRLNKYGNYMAWEEWDRVEEPRTERVVKATDAEGNPTAYDFDTVVRRVKDCPSFHIGDPKDFWFDSYIPEMNDQRCIVHKFQITYEQLVADQAAGKIMNVEKLSTAGLYEGEGDSDVLEDRLTNAGESDTVARNGLFVGYHIWGVIPVKEFKRKGKGKWDEKQLATRYWTTYIGELSSAGSVCVRFRKNPRHDMKVPYKFMHSHRDDKGAYHDGFAAMTKSLYWQAVTNKNQAIDNVTLINQAAWVLEGTMRTKMGRTRANKLFKIDRGSTLTQMDVRDATPGTMAMNDIIEKDIEQTTGADKPILGEALGSRTSATEAKQVFDQASMPLDDKAGYVADQLFPWLYEMDANDWRQNGNPETVVQITKNDNLDEIIAVSPTELWGPIRTKVTAVSRFRNNVQHRQELNVFIQNAYPQAVESMDEEGRSEFWRDAFKSFGFERWYDYFPSNVSYESRNAAIRALQDIMAGGDAQPDPRVNHRVWLSVFKPFTREYEVTPGNDPDVAAKLRQMVVAHEEMQAQAGQAAQAAAQQGQEPAITGQEGLPGEQLADPIEAQEGAIANV